MKLIDTKKHGKLYLKNKVYYVLRSDGYAVYAHNSRRKAKRFFGLWNGVEDAQRRLDNADCYVERHMYMNVAELYNMEFERLKRLKKI